MADAPDISVIIPTYNARETLGAALRSVIACDFPRERFEIIVIDDGSTDGSGDIVRAMAEEAAPLSVRYVMRDRSNGYGPGIARQDGMLVARGRVIAFTDADCVVDADWLRVIDERLVRGDAQLASGDTWCDQTVLFPWKMSPAGQHWITANLAVERELGLRVGFSHEFLGFNGDDTDFVYRLMDAGARSALVPNMRVFHPVRRMSFSQVVRRSAWRSNDVLLFKKYGARSLETLSPFFRPVLLGAISWATLSLLVGTVLLVLVLFSAEARTVVAFGLTAFVIAFMLRLYRACAMYVPPGSQAVTVTERARTLVFSLAYVPCIVVARLRGSIRHRILFL